MKLNPERIRAHLQQFEFTQLFVEDLGWEAPRSVKITAPTEYSVREVAHLGGIPALEVLCAHAFPDSKERRVIHQTISKQFHENLLLFVDAERTKMLWYWAKREGGTSAAGGKTSVREHPFVKGQPGDLFLSKLAGLFVDLEEYDSSGKFSVLRAGQKLKDALDVSKVTKKFYANFKTVHLELVELLEGIPTEAERKWYASVLLNRLMFVYFLQQKGFLDNGDYHYLENRFAQFQSGNIFEDFLGPLFFNAFALPDSHADKIAAQHIFGKIPYLNGGLFLPHAMEEKYAISLPNAGPENILGLFKSVTWYLNDVPGEDDNAMSPDVLGYIFEKYINDQKSAGAYYTPPEITEYLCERTIHDLVTERVQVLRGGVAKKYASVGDLLLDLDADSCRVTLGVLNELRLCDPAVGSGAFLVAALKTLTNLYGALWGRAEVLGDAELKRAIIGDAKKHQSHFYPIRKKIITQNLYGVDIMAEATEIARLRLFLSLVSSARTLDELEPLPNIEFNILAGNSLMGMLSVEENDFAYAGLFVKKDYDELAEEKERNLELYKNLEDLPQEERLGLKQRTESLRKSLHGLCDGALMEVFKNLKIQYEQAQPTGKAIKRELSEQDIEALTPFHWGYEFSKVMQNGGFDAIITNPPWEIWKPNAKEFFQQYSDVVTKKKMTIKEFETHQKELLQDNETAAAWREYLSGFPHVEAYYRNSPDYHNQISLINNRKAVSDVNLYKLFTERCFNLLNDGGRCGIVIPSGIYTDLGAKQLREMLFERTHVTGLFGFENRKEIFEGVHRSFKFVTLSFRKGGSTQSFPAAFMRHDVSELDSFPNRDSLQIGVELVRRLSPDSLSVMEFKSERDVEIAEKMLKFPLLGEKIEGLWNLVLGREFHMMDDRHLFLSTKEKNLPMIEGKNIWHFDDKYAEPRYWINEIEGRISLLGKNNDKSQKLNYQAPRFAMRRIASNTNERTIISTVLPPNVLTSESLHVSINVFSANEILFFTAIMNSFVLDFFARQKVTTNINQFTVYQFPIPRLSTPDPQFAPIVSRAARLICTMPEFDELAREAGMKSSADGATDATERARLRAELDGLVAHLYGLSEDDFAHILGTFPLVAEPVKLAARNAFRDIERGVLKV